MRQLWMSCLDKTADKQYTRKLLFSAVVELMTLVVCNKISVYQAFKKNRDRIGVSLQAVFDKLDRLELRISQMLVRHFASRLAAVVESMGAAVSEWLPGYRVKVMDGNHIAATEHRIEVLRDTAAGALPGFAVVVLDPRLQMAIDVFPEEDGHAQERSLGPMRFSKRLSRMTSGLTTATSAPWRCFSAWPGRAPFL